MPVSDGLFSVKLGSETEGGIPASILGGDVWLEVTVGGETLSPRELIRSVPIAGLALTVPDGAVTESKLAPGAVSKVSILRQDDTTNSLDDRVILAGWGYMQGNDTQRITEQVDFGFTFAEPPVVLATFLGGAGGGQPPEIGDFLGVGGGPKVFTPAPANISTPGFEMTFSRNIGNFGSSYFYGYSWIAIGAAP